MAETAAAILVERLSAWGVDTIFGLAGDALADVFEVMRRNPQSPRFIQVRHEEAAAFAACAYAKTTGRLGVCMATSGPGGIHLTNGLYDANANDQPVLAITGQTWSKFIGTRYQQEVALDRLFADVAGYTLDSPANAEAVLREAFDQPGPALIEAVVDPNEPPMPGRITTEQALALMNSLRKGQPHRWKIMQKAFRETIRELRDAPQAIL
ncbi:MAG: hypothetical protein GEU90_05515 [Gemmatimonas sp.]|nr:hypothetical protein [Gemmatimonas sp.]